MTIGFADYKMTQFFYIKFKLLKFYIVFSYI